MKFKKVCITYLLFFLSLTLVTGCGKKESADADKKDGNQQTASDNLSFHIKYDIKSNNPGTLDMYVNGNNIRIGINTNVDGQNVVVDLYRTNDGFVLVNNEKGKNVGLRFKDTEESGKDFKNLFDIAKVKEELKNFTKSGTEDILGYKCDIYKNDTAEFCLYKDLFTLRAKYSPKNGTPENIVALEFEPDKKFDNNFFVVPKDINVVDVNTLIDELDKMSDK